MTVAADQPSLFPELDPPPRLTGCCDPAWRAYDACQRAFDRAAKRASLDHGRSRAVEAARRDWLHRALAGALGEPTKH